MNVKAVLKLAPLMRAEDIAEFRRRGRTVFDAGALQTLNRDTPVVIDHDLARTAGYVNEISTWPDATGLWAWAICTITDAPEWLRRGTPVSLGFKPFFARDMDGFQLVRRAGVKEISILGPGQQPYEPQARVAMISPASASSDPEAGETILYGNGQKVRRYFRTTITVR